MPTFSELLRNYIERTGISDSELARSVGVRRQTIFRWKEGLVARPRHRDDVLRVASRLRLSDDERDGLLLAAGFPPERAAFSVISESDASESDASESDASESDASESDASESDASESDASESDVSESDVSESDVSESDASEAVDDQAISNKHYANKASGELPTTPRPRWPRLAWIGLAALLVLLSLAITPVLRDRSSANDGPTAIRAAEGETLLLVARFVGYTDDDFNVAGRILDALSTQLEAAGLDDARALEWSEAVSSGAEAGAVLAASGAAAVIWGDYDDGRVRVNFALDAEENPAWERLLTEQDDLPTVINVDVPRETQALALITLGRLYRAQGANDRAIATFERALTLDIDDEATLATIYFYLANVQELASPSNLEQAIANYGEALRLNRGQTTARANRGTAFLSRYIFHTQDPADLDRAIADLNRVVSVDPAYAPAWLNRGTAYYERKEPGDLEAAIDDLTQAIELDDSLFRAYYNRALARIRLNEAGWQEDLAEVLTLDPDFALTYNALCWGNMLDQQPEQALPHCDEAVNRDPTGASRDSRGIVYAQLGRTDEAIVELEAYLAWLGTLSPALYAEYNGPLVEGWIASLEAGENPFDDETLAELRR